MGAAGGALVAALLAAVLAALLVVVPPTAVAAPPGFCSLSGMTTFVWDGEGGDGLWSTDANWSNDTEPDLTYGSTGYVCIPDGAVVTLQAGERADLQAIDLEGGAELTLATGSKLYVYGDQSARPSYVRQGALVQLSGTFGGPGRLDLLGRMRWTSTQFGASTIATRDCALGPGAPEPGDDDDSDSCAAPVSGPRGRIVVGDRGTIVVDGRGVNFEDQYVLVVRGQLRLTGDAYIAADRGTRTVLSTRLSTSGVGTFLISNDGGYYEGRTTNGVTTLSELVNGGRIVKNAGTGASVISAAYSEVSPGSVRVDTGLLSLPELVPASPTGPAQVGGGASYGVGRCEAMSGLACRPVTEGPVKQSGAFRVPGADANGANVQLFRRSGGPAGTIGKPFQVHATGLRATQAKPAILTLRFDSSILGGQSVGDVQIFRRPDGAATFVKVARCRGDGRPPAGKVACVDRRGLAGSSRNVLDPGDTAGDPVDVIMVIRTTGTSRWVGR